MSDDLQLIARISRGDASGLDALYDRYARLVFSVAIAIVEDHRIAEEVTLDVFVRVWQRASSYHPERAAVRTWIIAITRHHAIDVLRWRKSRPDSRAVSLDDLLHVDDPLATDPPANAEDAARAKRVQDALGYLPEDQRRPLALAFFKGLTHQEIADLLGQPVGTVKTRIRLALQKLRRLLADDAPPDPSGGK